MGLLIFLLLIIAAIVACVMIRNNIVRHHNASIRAWSDVASYERQKIKILDGLQPLVEQYSNFEQGTLEKVTELRQNILNLNVNTTDVSQLQRIESLNKELMHSLNVVVENYPELKANQNFLELQAQLEGTENRIATERGRFNELSKDFNATVRKFPTNIVASLAGFEKKAYFEAEEGSEKAPEVKF